MNFYFLTYFCSQNIYVSVSSRTLLTVAHVLLNLALALMVSQESTMAGAFPCHYCQSLYAGACFSMVLVLYGSGQQRLDYQYLVQRTQRRISFTIDSLGLKA
jgi:hypothetical protein